MPFCQACGTSVTSDARFCNACGKPANITATPGPPVAAASGAVALPIETLAATPNAELPRTPASAVLGARSNEKASRAHRPRGVTTLAVLAFLGVLATATLGTIALSYGASARAEGATPPMQLLMSLFPVLATGQHEMVSDASNAATAMFAIAAICAVVSYGLWTLRRWGRIVAIVASILTALHAVGMILTSSGTLIWHLFAIGLNIWIITYLLKPHVKQAFGAQPV